MNRQYIFIISGRADQKSLRTLETALAGISAEIRTHFEFRYTEYPGHAGDIAREVRKVYYCCKRKEFKDEIWEQWKD